MKYLFVIFAISFAVLLGAAQIVFAGHLAAACIDSGYNKAGGCQVGATYGDQGGSELQSCQYRVVSNGEQTVGWTNASEGTCSGSQAFLWTNPITISGTGNCNDEGVAKCLIYAKAIDNGGNETTNQIATLDIDYSLPVVSATNASSQWFTSRTTTLSVSDTGGSTLAQARYSWDTNTMNSSCTSGGTTFTNGAVLTVAQGSHRLYLCARDGAGNLTSPNPWDSGADQYRVDYTAPTYQAFTVNGVFCSGFSCPATVTTSSPLTITWSASDTGGSGIQKHEVWRSKDGEPWFLIQDNAISPFSNTPPSSGTWWYGVHSVDNTGNCIQDNGGHCGGVSSDSLDDRTARGPIRVIFGDQIAPTIDSFSTSPTTWTNGSITVSWTVSDNAGGTGIQEVEVWRAPDAGGSPGSWSNVKDNAVSPHVDSPSDGKWWYGIHVTDNTGNCIKEDTSGSDKGHCGGVTSDTSDTRTDRGPLQALVDKTPPPAPILITPINNQTISTARPSFDWDNVTDLSGITSYRIRVNNTPNFSNLEIDTTVTSSSYPANVDLGEGNQYWWVSATNGAGLTGQDSNRGDFQIQINETPNASFTCTPTNCTVFTFQTLTFNNTSTDPDGSGDITKSEWDILGWGSSPDTTCTSSPLCSYILPSSVPANTYTMQLKVGDGSGVSNTTTGSFTVQQDTNSPVVSSFTANPAPPAWVNIASPNATVSWTVSDSGGSNLKQIEVWRARDNNGDQALQPGEWGANYIFVKTSGFDSSSADTDSYTDTSLPVEERMYWYGLHVVDNQGNLGTESTPPKVQVDKIAPGVPTLVSPINNAVVTTSRPSFDWNDVAGDLSGISLYNIRGNNTPNFSNLEIDASVSSSSYTSTVDLGEGNQYWWVRATDGAGNQGGDSSRGDFQINLNQPPNASFNCSPGNCTVFNTETLTFNNNSTDPDGSGDISKSEWDILNWGTSPDATCTSPSALCNHTLQSISPNTYTMQLRVEDVSGASDTDTKSFTVKRDIVAGFMCSLDNVNFVACSSLSGQISQEEVLYLKDSSSLSEYTIVSQGASSVTNRTWEINGSTFGGNSSNPSTTIPTQGTITLELTAQDNQGRSDIQTHTLNPQVPFPEFQEISPF